MSQTSSSDSATLKSPITTRGSPGSASSSVCRRAASQSSLYGYCASSIARPFGTYTLITCSGRPPPTGWHRALA